MKPDTIPSADGIRAVPRAIRSTLTSGKSGERLGKVPSLGKITKEKRNKNIIRKETCY